jgi:hypothetical protein
MTFVVPKPATSQTSLGRYADLDVAAGVLPNAFAESNVLILFNIIDFPSRKLRIAPNGTRCIKWAYTPT